MRQEKMKKDLLLIKVLVICFNIERILSDIRKKLFSNLIRGNYTYLNIIISDETKLHILSDVKNERNLVIDPINEF